jgi:hypothetical protein
VRVLNSVPTNICVLLLLLVGIASAGIAVDERPAAENEWGFRPAGASSELNPPRFSWRPQEKEKAYTIEASRDAAFGKVDYRADSVAFNVHTPPKTFEPGKWHWRFRFVDAAGAESTWSTTRTFEIPASATEFVLPPRDELLARVPSSHPRLFVRPEEIADLRQRANGDLKLQASDLLRAAEKLLKNPAPTDEPPLYPPGTVSHSEQWRTYWWGGHDAAHRTLEPAALLGFAYQLTGDKRFGEEAHRILMAASKWDPTGSSGYRYNDEAGMPYNYLFSRTYTFIHDLLSESERAECRRIMTIRGREMYQHLCPSHFWSPYHSHQNRAWHFLGEVAVAFHGEIPEADDWLRFSLNVFSNVYPVWNDSDGGWHEGTAYWRSYLDRFTWWAEVMKSAVGIDAYRLPFFSQAGYYAMYVLPPGTPVGGFGDQTNLTTSAGAAQLVSVFARQAQNPYWQWYADAHPQADDTGGYIGFIRAARYPTVKPKPPTDLPTSRVFRGIGLAAMNSDLTDASKNVEVLFKSSPFGSQSHGYDAQNSFSLYAFGQPLLISSGVRDIYGSDHHANWMWETKSTNNITISGRGQIKHSPKSVGRITAFESTPAVDFVQGDASKAFDPPLKKWLRTIVSVKPGLVAIIDELETEKPETFQFWLHSPVRMKIAGQERISIEAEKANCRISILSPGELKLTQSDVFDAPLRERIKLTQYHLKAETTQPATKQRFVTVLRPYRPADTTPSNATLTNDGDGLVIRSGDTDIRWTDHQAIISHKAKTIGTFKHD